MKKYIRLYFPNGKVFDIPASFVADKRATYYAEKDETVTYEEEYEFTMSDEYELKDWLQNNQNWVDVKDIAKEIPQEPYDYGKNFCNCEMEIIEK